MRIFLLAILLTLLEVTALSQTSPIPFDSFEEMLSVGKVPDDFKASSTSKYQKDLGTIDSELKKKDQQLQADFYLQSNFLFDELLKGGDVIFGDPVTTYLEKVLDRVLASDPSLRKELRVYTFKSSIPNAFTNNNGIILVTTGLLAQLENEAQLAFILAHEAIHYKEKHSINNYTENILIAEGKGVYKNLDPDQVELTQFSYSRDLETASDLGGLEYYLQTEYASAQAVRAMDILLYSYLPFDEVPYDLHVLGNQYYELPEKLLIDEDLLNPISAYEDYDDSKNTHPNIKSRKEALSDELSATSSNGAALFLVGDEQSFAQIQDACRFQSVLLNIRSTNYEAALYDIFLLERKYPDNYFLKKSAFRCIYSFSLFKNYSGSPDGRVSYRKIEGASQPLYYFFQKADKPTLNALAIRNGWLFLQAFPDDKDATEMMRQLAYIFKYDNKEHLKDYKNASSIEKILSDSSSVNLEVDPPVGKIDNIKKKKDGENKDSYFTLFAEFRDNPKFFKLFDIPERKEQSVSDEAKVAIHAEKVMLLEPVYLRFDLRSDQPVKFEASEEALLSLKSTSRDVATAARLPIAYLDKQIEQGDDAEKLNELATLNRWFSEQLTYLDNEVPIMNTSQSAFTAILEKYQCSHIMWLGIASFHESKSILGIIGRYLVCLYFPPAIPFAIVNTFTQNYYTQAFSLVANAETGNFDLAYELSIAMKDLPSVQKSLIYNIMNELK